MARPAAAVTVAAGPHAGRVDPAAGARHHTTGVRGRAVPCGSARAAYSPATAADAGRWSNQSKAALPSVTYIPITRPVKPVATWVDR